MNVLLVNPSDKHVDGSLKGGVWHAPPLGLAYIGSVLTDSGHNVKILDLAVHSNGVKEYCAQFKPDIVGFTATTPTLKNALSHAKSVKTSLPHVKIIFGGPHPSADPSGILQNDFIDFVVIGEGEETITELVSSIEAGSDYGKVNGIAFKKDGDVVVTEKRDLIGDLDSIPLPARDLLDVFAYPNHPLSRRSPSTTLLTSRGCPFNCIYCDKSVFGRTFRARSAASVVDEIEFLVNEYGIKEIHFIDDTLTLNKERMIEICKGIIDRKLDISWMTPNGVRVNSVDNESLSWMRKAGCHYLYLGIESGNQQILDNIQKDITLENVRETVSIIRKSGINVGGFFMIGLPGESPKEVDETIKFARSLKLDSVKFGVTVPLPGTELFDIWVEKGVIKNYNFEEYFWHKEPIFETDTLSKEEIMAYYKKAYRMFYLNPEYVFHRITNIRSISDLKNNFNGLITVLKNQLSI